MNPYNYITDPINESTISVFSDKGRNILESYATFTSNINNYTYKKQHYIVGYGSLILSESRYKTLSKGDCTPIILKGYKRSWCIPTEYKERYKYTAVGATKSDNNKDIINGVLLEIKPEEFVYLDEREKSYSRNIVNISNIIPYNTGENITKKLENSTVWIYLKSYKKNKLEYATPIYPIIQSYVDIALLGCGRISTEFAKLFIETTKGWDNKYSTESIWKNDRVCPIRFEIKLNDNQQVCIDQLLIGIIPESFKKRSLITL